MYSSSILKFGTRKWFKFHVKRELNTLGFEIYRPSIRDYTKNRLIKKFFLQSVSYAAKGQNPHAGHFFKLVIESKYEKCNRVSGDSNK